MVRKESSYSPERGKYSVTSAFIRIQGRHKSYQPWPKLYRKGGFISFAPSESAWFGLETHFIYLK